MADGTEKSTTALSALNKGHRERLRGRFISAPEAVPDYEVLELLLFGTIPQRDVKPLAKALIDRFGSLGGVLNAEPEQLAEIKIGPLSVGSSTIANLFAVREAGRRVSQAKVMKREVVSSWTALLDYCTTSMAHNPVEQFRILFLDRQNVLIADEVQQKGTIDHTPVYPREVMKRALALNASAIILVHNHPSGDPSPSSADIEMTKRIIDTAKPLGIAVHDHLVIGKGRHASFKTLGLI